MAVPGRQRITTTEQMDDRETDTGVLLFEAGQSVKAATAFAAAIGKCRHFARHSDPPSI